MSNPLIRSGLWPTNLPLEYAEFLEAQPYPLQSEEDLMLKYSLSVAELNQLKDNPQFKQEVLAFRNEMQDPTSLVRKKAQTQFQFYLDTEIPRLMCDVDVPPGEKVKLFQYLGKLAEFTDNVKDLPTQQISQPSLVLNFANIPELQPMKEVKQTDE